MKIRIGVGFSGWPFARTKDFWDFVDLVEESGLDSIWLNDPNISEVTDSVTRTIG